MIPTEINGRWTLKLPPHRAERPEWVAWEVERIDSLHRNIVPGDVIFDVGAEEGDMSALWATWAGPDGGVVLVEPNPKVWPNIRAIWEANELPHPRGWYVGFFSDRTEENPLNRNVDDEERDGWPACAYGPMIADHGFRHLAQEADATPQITMDAWVGFSNVHPDIVTMDVEGAELAVLRGASFVLERWKPLVYVSIHPEFLRDLYDASDADVYGFMNGHGYEGRLLDIDHEMHVVFEHPRGRRLLL